MKVNAWNIYSVVRENARLVVTTDHDVSTVTAALDVAEELARVWNANENRADMLVTMLTCNGYIRSIPTQSTLFQAQG